MRKLSKTGLMVFLAALLFSSANNYAQIEELGRFIAAGKNDAQLLLQPYITPAVNAFGASLAGGWYNTAGTHKLGGFDLTITLNTCIIPKKYKTFVIDNDALTLLKLADPGDNVSQTIAGDRIQGPDIVYNFDDPVPYQAPAFSMPRGLNSNIIPSPMIQVGVGLIKGTELIFRYLPNIKVRGNEFGLWGLGGKHDIKQWIPGLKKLPVWQLSIMYGFTKLHTNVGLMVDKATIGAAGLPGEEGNQWSDQNMKLIVKSQTANVLVAANLKVITFYGGIGFVTTKTNLKFEGDYPVVYMDGATASVQAMTDPIDMEIKNQDGGVTKPRLNAGVRFKLAVVTIHIDYSWANYNVLTGGVGISIR